MLLLVINASMQMNSYSGEQSSFGHSGASGLKFIRILMSQ
jgi:hypothetical protein